MSRSRPLPLPSSRGTRRQRHAPSLPPQPCGRGRARRPRARRKALRATLWRKQRPPGLRATLCARARRGRRNWALEEAAAGRRTPTRSTGACARTRARALPSAQAAAQPPPPPFPFGRHLESILAALTPALTRSCVCRPVPRRIRLRARHPCGPVASDSSASSSGRSDSRGSSSDSIRRCKGHRFQNQFRINSESMPPSVAVQGEVRPRAAR
jgi:hypothetical protein